MSIRKKLQSFKKSLLDELSKKEADLLNLKNDVNKVIEQTREKITFESNRLDTGFKLLSQEKERFEKQKESFEIHREKSKQEIETLRVATQKKINVYRLQQMAEIAEAENRLDEHIDDVIEYFEELETFGKDPKIVDAYINACFILDEKLAQYFEDKRPPNQRAAEITRALRKENKGYLQRIMELEYQISEFWAKDIDTSEKEDFEYLDDDDDRVKAFLSSSDLAKPEMERNQKALENYLNKSHSKSYVGKMYERYIGYLYEQEGYDVEYRGIEMGLKDGGIDLVCNKHGEILLVQCKNWRQDSIIFEKHICQLYGASKFYDKENIKREFGETLFSNIEWKKVTPVFVSTTQLDEHAAVVADTLGVKIRYEALRKDYPIIKGNINNTGEHIYHLPFDQMYDKTKIIKSKGERWFSTVQEAEKAGFRRAKRHFFTDGN